ncbi:hypothetical protein ACP70R_025997 [Stipagrostis hirtigluma subsp. patula]
MAFPKVSRRAPSFLALVVVALAASSCYASGDAPAPGPSEVVFRGAPKCEVQLPCTGFTCNTYCIQSGLPPRGFCTFKPDLQFYCCCPVPASPAPETPTTPTSSSKSRMHLGSSA